MSQTLQGILIFLHDLFTAIWVGGLLMLCLSVLPGLKKVFGHSAESEKAMDAITRQQRKFVFIAMPGLLITGVLLARTSAGFNGLFNFTTSFGALLSVKHILVFLMVILALVRAFGFRNLEKSKDLARKKTSLLLMHINAALGVLVLLLSGLAVAI